MRQLIIARKDLQMSPGKLAAQVSHASMAFLTTQIRKNARKVWKYKTYQSFQVEPFSEKRIPGPRLYKHGGLCRFSQEAYEKGQDYFTARPIDSENMDAGLELCENEYDSYAAELTIYLWAEGSEDQYLSGRRGKRRFLSCFGHAGNL